MKRRSKLKQTDIDAVLGVLTESGVMKDLLRVDELKRHFSSREEKQRKKHVYSDEDCEHCDGTGEVPRFRRNTPRDSFDYCPECGGVGKKIIEFKGEQKQTGVKPRREINLDED